MVKLDIETGDIVATANYWRKIMYLLKGLILD